MPTEDTGDQNPADDTGNKAQEPDETNACDCLCPVVQAKDCSGQNKSLKYIPISHSTFFGSSLDELFIGICNLIYSLGERTGIIRTSNEDSACNNNEGKRCSMDDTGTGKEVQVKNDKTDIVEWLHDEFVLLAKETANSNTQGNPCCCGEGKRADYISLQARRNVLNELAEMLDKKNNQSK